LSLENKEWEHLDHIFQESSWKEQKEAWVSKELSKFLHSCPPEPNTEDTIIPDPALEVAEEALLLVLSP